MTWTTQLTYGAAAVTAADAAAPGDALVQAEVTHDASSNRLRTSPAVEASALEEASGTGLRAAAAVTGRAHPTRLVYKAPPISSPTLRISHHWTSTLLASPRSAAKVFRGSAPANSPVTPTFPYISYVQPRGSSTRGRLSGPSMSAGRPIAPSGSQAGQIRWSRQLSALSQELRCATTWSRSGTPQHAAGGPRGACDDHRRL